MARSEEIAQTVLRFEALAQQVQAALTLLGNGGRHAHAHRPVRTVLMRPT
jgi:hypothetical protein